MDREEDLEPARNRLGIKRRIAEERSILILEEMNIM